ncbi:hypothetical protein [Actinokineospora pegani]|uniref:hypothetical protein n=1 Tax=Actinokineospora pegani TaxID=2654637 RepID=UPI0012EA63E2|nr:hypothetical protein [Actinokineospora pegani]
MNPTLTRLIATLQALTTTSTQIGYSLEAGFLNPPEVRELELLEAQIAATAHRLLADQHPAPSAPDSPRPTQAPSLNANLGDLPLYAEEMLTAYLAKNLTLKQVSAFLLVLNDATHSVRWLLDNKDTPQGKDLLNELTLPELRYPTTTNEEKSDANGNA